MTLLIGASGAGKSVLVKILAGLIGREDRDFAISGSVRIAGTEILGGAAPGSDRPHVGIVFQNFALFDELSPLDNVRLARSHAVRPDETAEPADLLEELRVPTDVRTASLSGGQRQRLAIARTLAYHPDVVLYDEPTSGLDVATAQQVATLIQGTHQRHPKTSIVVTHDYAALAGIADKVYLLDPGQKSLREVEQAAPPLYAGGAGGGSATRGQGADAPRSPNLDLAPFPPQPREDVLPESRGDRWRRYGRSILRAASAFLVASSRTAEETVLFPLRLLPLWKSPRWGVRFFLHYLRLVADPSAWLYMAMSGAIMGFVSTYFTFKHFPYAHFTAPLLTDEVLKSLGFAMYRILVPVLATILIAARCGAAVASDVGGKVYGQQHDALRTFGVRPPSYLLTGICWAFLLGAPLLVGISFIVAKYTSLAVFTAIEPAWGPYYWDQHFHRALREPESWLYDGTGWLLLKVLLCAAGIAQISYHIAARPKYSGNDVSAGITSTILWSTLYVLVVHFAMAFVEF